MSSRSPDGHPTGRLRRAAAIWPRPMILLATTGLLAWEAASPGAPLRSAASIGDLARHLIRGSEATTTSPAPPSPTAPPTALEGRRVLRVAVDPDNHPLSHDSSGAARTPTPGEKPTKRKDRSPAGAIQRSVPMRTAHGGRGDGYCHRSSSIQISRPLFRLERQRVCLGRDLRRRFLVAEMGVGRSSTCTDASGLGCTPRPWWPRSTSPCPVPVSIPTCR